VLIITSAILGHCCCYCINFCISLICLEASSSTTCIFQPNYLEFNQLTLLWLSRAEGSFSVKARNRTGNLVVQSWFGQEDCHLVSVIFFLFSCSSLAENMLPEVTQGKGQTFSSLLKLNRKLTQFQTPSQSRQLCCVSKDTVLWQSFT